MNLLTGLFIVLCLMAFVNAEGHRSRRQNFKVFKQRRLNSDNLGRRGNYNDDFKEETISLSSSIPSPTTTITSTGTIPTGTGTITTSPARGTGFNKMKEDKDYLEYEQLVNSFDQDELDDKIELNKPRRRKNRRQTTRRRHHHHQ